MEKTLTLRNEALSVEVRLPGSTPESERFDSACVVKQVTLHGRHCFCQPEQLIESRVTCYGFGLCAEYDMNDAGLEARRGEQFPKPGVGLLTQIEDGKPYDMWSHYEIARYPKTWRMGEDWIEFDEEPVPCRGIALSIRRRLQLVNNSIRLDTTVYNAGERLVDFSEYQHNFVSIDDIPVDKGYVLEVPFDGTLGNLPNCFRQRDTFTPIPESSVRVEGQRAFWTQNMPNRTYHKTTLEGDILPCDTYWWRLSHANSSASIREVTGFKPWRLVMWGIEHCICCEVYCRIQAAPGETATYSRTWYFEDEETRE